MDTLNTLIVNWPVCVIGLLIATAGVVVTFLARRWSALLMFVALTVVYFWGNAGISDSAWFFWGAATLIAWGICYLLPKPVAASRTGLGYIAGATLAGALVGLIMSAAGLVTGAIVGAFCGALAFSRTPDGRALEFPSSKFLHYLCAKGLPAVVVMCVFGLLIEAIFSL